jgi:hypothetical protein
MLRALAGTLLAFVAAAAASGQDPAPVYQQQKQKAYRFAGDTTARYEWTQDILKPDGSKERQNRYRLQVRPRVELRFGPVELGVGGEFNYSDDENDVPPPEQETLAIIRDNYRSRDVRLDLAYAKVTIGPVAVQGGRFFMPLPLTEMVWDRDLRPQGGAVTVAFGPETGTRFAVHGIYAYGSHVFEDESVMFGGGAELRLGSSLHVAASYLQSDELAKLEEPIRRQNTRALGFIVGDYKVVDIVGRLTRRGQLPLQLVADYCWNTAKDSDNQGLWLAAVLGAIGSSRAQLEYTYAKVDKDAVVAAFDTDDFFWGTGWEGHRVDLGSGTVKSSSMHAIAQWQRFKDSPDPAAREQWVTRYRLEWRTSFQ